MAEITGRETVIALKKAATWRTAVAVGAGDGMFITSDGLTAGHSFDIMNDEDIPKGWVEDTNTGLETVAGDIPALLRYQGQELPIALAMGDSQAKAGVGPYTWECYLLSSIRGLFATYVSLLESTIVSEIPSVVITGFDITANFGEQATITFHTIGNRKLITGQAGIVNTTTETDAVTIDNDVKQNVVVFNGDSDFLLNTEGGGALSAGDRKGIGSFTFSFNRPTDPFAVVNATDTGIEEVVQSGFEPPTFAISKPQFDAVDSVAWLQAFESGATFKSALTFAKGTDYEFNLYMPRMRVVEDAPAVPGPGRIPNDLTLRLLQATASPTGFNSAFPFYITTKNNAAAAPF
jgi:hypothetical protein